MLTKLARKCLREWKKNRKPLYFINKKNSHDKEINENNKSKVQNNSKSVSDNFNDFIKRNYEIPLKNKADKIEKANDLSLGLYSDTCFIPVINNQSKILTENRENNKSDEVFINLYKDASYLNEKKVNLIRDRYKKFMQDEVKEATFYPSTAEKQIFVPKYMDPKKYLKINEGYKYINKYKQSRLRSSKSTDLLKQRLLVNSIPERCLVKGLQNSSVVSLNKNVKRNLNNDFEEVKHIEEVSPSDNSEYFDHESLAEINILEMSYSEKQSSIISSSKSNERKALIDDKFCTNNSPSQPGSCALLNKSKDGYSSPFVVYPTSKFNSLRIIDSHSSLLINNKENIVSFNQNSISSSNPIENQL